MKPGDLFRRNLINPSNITIFGDFIHDDREWIALVLNVTPPGFSTHYHVIEALVQPQNSVMKTYLLAEEMENLVEVLR